VFDIDVPRLPKAGNRALTLEKNKKIPSKEDINEVLKYADTLGKALVLVGISSGLASEEIRNLKVGQFKAGYDPETEITTLTLRRKKAGYDFVTFFSPEASHAVWDYLKLRETNEKQKIHNDSDYLFIPKWIKDEYLTTHDENLRRLSNWGFMLQYRQMSSKAQKNTPHGDWNLIRSHNMRKFYNSTMLNAGADSFFVEFTMGHTLDETRSAYFRAAPGKLCEIYKKHVAFLTINKNIDVASSPEYRDIVEQRDTEKAAKEHYKIEQYQFTSEMEKMRKELEEMKAFNKTTSDIMGDQAAFYEFLKFKKFMETNEK
jgi:integrase